MIVIEKSPKDWISTFWEIVMKYGDTNTFFVRSCSFIDMSSAAKSESWAKSSVRGSPSLCLS